MLDFVPLDQGTDLQVWPSPTSSIVLLLLGSQALLSVGDASGCRCRCWRLQAPGASGSPDNVIVSYLTNGLSQPDIDFAIANLCRLMTNPMEYGTLPASYKQVDLHHGIAVDAVPAGRMHSTHSPGRGAQN